MKAIAKIKREPGIEVIDIEPDQFEENQVLLRMRSASICGSDLGLYDFAASYQKFAKIPVIMGHEFSGEIEGVGKKVTTVNAGERVVCESVLYCGTCKFCRSGITNICKNFTVFGMHRNGGFAELVSVDPKFLHAIPNNVTFVEAGIVEPLSVVVNALDDVGDVRLSQSATIIGPGPLGLLSAEVLMSKGLNEITIVGVNVDEFRLKIARDLLSFHTMNSETENVQEEIKERTDGYGNDLVIVTAGAPAALQSALPLISKGGQIIVLGIFPSEITLPISDIVRRQVSMRGSYGSRWIHYEKAISLVAAKKIRTEAIVTHRFGLEKANEAFQTAKSKTGCKVQFYT